MEVKPREIQPIEIDDEAQKIFEQIAYLQRRIEESMMVDEKILKGKNETNTKDEI